MRRLLSIAALSILTLSASASAQRSLTKPSPEVGMDAAVTFGLGNGQGTFTSIPAQSIHMGFFLSPALSIEPMFGLSSASGGGTTITTYNIGTGALYHFSPSRTANQLYVRPFVQIAGFSGSGVSDSQALFGVGGGIKIPVRDRIASRFEANFAHTDGSDMVGLVAGLSFYTR
jgi:hypothetical protein